MVTELGPTLNGTRGRFLALLRVGSVTTIVVEHRDRFARFGAECVEAAPTASGRRLPGVDPAAVDGNLAADLAQILTSLSARYGWRAAAAWAWRPGGAVVGAGR